MKATFQFNTAAAHTEKSLIYTVWVKNPPPDVI